ncbi:MAG: glucose-6-phosphate isomerase [Tannerellaceae bacterium]|jgi:glucose-6-phosphate isomerase|nr:glucose-6-phosphate isomerase [Tannerellaceae bacterium]
MKLISLDIDNLLDTMAEKHLFAQKKRAMESIERLHEGTGAGSDFLGWLEISKSYTDKSLLEIVNAAYRLRCKCEVVVVIGIGGSYLGAKAAIDALSNSFDWLERDRRNPVIVYAGHNIGEDYLYELSEMLKGKEFGIINISKSGTTTEPALAFRLLKKQLEEAVGRDEARSRIIAVTDAHRGALRTLAEQEGYQTFVIPDNVGGRFSVLTPVGLLPIAVAGISIHQLLSGAVEMQMATSDAAPFEDNIATIYATVRNELYKRGKKIELLANFHPKLHYMGEWWKQLYGESEGKEHKGIFPATVDLTTDLHSMGQWIQEGERSIFETVISVEEPIHSVIVPADEADLDGLNYLAGKHVDEVNKKAERGTQLAHIAGGVPNIKITLPELSPYYLGQLFYFFEKACAISGYMLGVNPFDQPGVEAYKKKMFTLLSKPGYGIS